MSESTKGQKGGTPKKKLSWKEKLVLLPEEEAAAIRAKAAEASRISKARKRGTTPEQSAVTRLEARLAKTDTQLAELKALRTELATELKEARKALAAAEKAEAQDKTTVAKDEQEIGMAEAGDDERFPTEDEYNA